MGKADIAKVHPVYRICVDLEKKYNWGFDFVEDTGDFETAIEFKIMTPPLCKPGESTVVPLHPPISRNWKEAENILVPDILAFTDRIIIEVEEETGNRRKGATLAKKGHGHPGDLTNKRDSRRDSFYFLADFRLLKIWESELDDEKKLRKKLWKFLSDCFCNRIDTISTPALRSVN